MTAEFGGAETGVPHRRTPPPLSRRFTAIPASGRLSTGAGPKRFEPCARRLPGCVRHRIFVARGHVALHAQSLAQLENAAAVAAFCSALWSGFSPPLTPDRFLHRVITRRADGIADSFHGPNLRVGKRDSSSSAFLIAYKTQPVRWVCQGRGTPGTAGILARRRCSQGRCCEPVPRAGSPRSQKGGPRLCEAAGPG